MKYNHHLTLSKISHKIKNRLKTIDNILEMVNDDLRSELREEWEYLQIREIKLYKLTLGLWRNFYAES